MALIVEDGTGLATAESYISVADADTYHAARGAVEWAAAGTTDKEAALRQATDYMEGAFSDRWKGKRFTSEQALSWPRAGAYAHGWLVDSDVVPVQVRTACAELALRALAAPLLADQERAIRREAIGPLETEYEPGAPQAPKYPAINARLASLLVGAGGMAIRA